MSVSDINFRHVGVQTPYGEIYGMCLAYPSRGEAERAFTVFRDYITGQSGGKSLHVEFRSGTSGTYGLTIAVTLPETDLRVSIQGVDAEYVSRLRTSLGVFMYYVILCGYDSDKGFALLQPRNHHLLKRDVLINGELVEGQPKVPIQWAGLFGDDLN
jgi:hypothetical protein